MASPTRLQLDSETKAAEEPHRHNDELRLWLRMLTCTTMIETEVRRRLRDQFATTLPRFDLMAQLERTPQGMTLGEVSRRMMVSNGNITSLVERLVESGQLERWSLPTDRRVQVVALTKAGRMEFSRMAKAHEAWIAEMFDALPPAEIEQLLKLLSRLKLSVHEAMAGADAP